MKLSGIVTLVLMTACGTTNHLGPRVCHDSLGVQTAPTASLKLRHAVERATLRWRRQLGRYVLVTNGLGNVLVRVVPTGAIGSTHLIQYGGCTAAAVVQLDPRSLTLSEPELSDMLYRQFGHILGLHRCQEADQPICEVIPPEPTDQELSWLHERYRRPPDE